MCFYYKNSFWFISWTLSWIMTKDKKKNWGFNIKVFLTIIFHLYVLSMYVHLCLFLMNCIGKSFRKLYQYQLSALGRGEWVISYWQLHFCCEKEKSFDLLAARSCRCIHILLCIIKTWLLLLLTSLSVVPTLTLKVRILFSLFQRRFVHLIQQYCVDSYHNYLLM